MIELAVGAFIVGFLAGRIVFGLFEFKKGYEQGLAAGDHRGFLRGVEAVRRAVIGK